MNKNILCRRICTLFLLGFLLGVHEGRLALWKDGEDKPWRVFPCPIIAFPAQTQAELKKGIPIESMEDLNKLLENLLS